jgi:hypothetical protein
LAGLKGGKDAVIFNPLKSFAPIGKGCFDGVMFKANKKRATSAAEIEPWSGV